MAKATFQDIPPELRPVFNRSLQQRDRYKLGVVQSQRRELSDRAKAKLRRASIVNSPQEGRGSLFRYLAPLWKGLTPEQKQVWRDAGTYSNITNWQLFISDNAVRIRNSLPLEVPPSELWQVRAGTLTIESPATEIILRQDHPQDYYVAQKVRGAPWKKELVLIKETFSLPLSLEIRYKADLVATGPTQSARYYAKVWTSYQGNNIETDIEIPFSIDTDWVVAEISTSGLRGILVGYTLFIEIIGYTGQLLYDNIRAVHSGTNWARDPRCDAIDTIFKNAFSVVPPFWVPVSLPSGSSYVSAYPPLLS